MATKKIGIVSLGCAKNLVDSEIMLGLLRDAGCEITSDPEDADAIIINTCAFIGPAKEESIDTILDMAQYKETGNCKALIVTGCLSERYSEELLQELPEVDAVVGTGDFDRIVDIVNRTTGGERLREVTHKTISYDRDLPRVVSTGNHSAYIKIAEGCDHTCAFCVIPSLRGPYRSRSMESIIEEAKRLAKQGTKEIVLIAQDTSAYGLDLYRAAMLPELLRKLCRIEGIEWIRVLYTYPSNFTDELIDVIASEPKVCKYVDLPLQHSHDAVLQRMKRPGSRKKMLELIEKLRGRVPGVALRSSFIVGFPGETEEEFTDLAHFLEEVQFDHVGVFTFSQEEGTSAFSLPEQIDEETKLSRRQRLMELQQSISLKKNRARIGEVHRVLVQGVSEESDLVVEARGEWQAPDVDGVVYIGDASLKPGSMVKVRIQQAFEYDLVGEVVGDEN